MNQIKYNRYKKKAGSKTAFQIEEGNPFFTEAVYLINPRYVHGRSPAFSLVNGKGKHISGLYPVCENGFIGDYQKKTILLFILQENSGFDLFLSEEEPIQVKAKVKSSVIYNELLKARKQA